LKLSVLKGLKPSYDSFLEETTKLSFLKQSFRKTMVYINGKTIVFGKNDPLLNENDSDETDRCGIKMTKKY